MATTTVILGLFLVYNTIRRDCPTGEPDWDHEAVGPGLADLFLSAW
jgi:hypothetical protein